jgi:hypothetical protein
MSSASTIYSVCTYSDCAAHGALQNGDRGTLWRFPSELLAVPDQRRTASRIRTFTVVERFVYALALRRIRDTGRADRKNAPEIDAIASTPV